MIPYFLHAGLEPKVAVLKRQRLRAALHLAESNPTKAAELLKLSYHSLRNASGLKLSE